MRRGLLLGLVAVSVFVIVAAVMIQVIPGPLKDSDFLVIGSVATLVALLVLFVVLLATSMKSSNVFFRKRKK